MPTRRAQGLPSLEGPAGGGVSSGGISSCVLSWISVSSASPGLSTSGGMMAVGDCLTRSGESDKVLVAGEGVKKPAEYYLKGQTSALEILTRAGWVSTGTDSRDIELTRVDGTVQRWDLAVLASDPDKDVQLRNGDRLMVHEGNQVYVAGEVKEPGGIPYVDGLTALQALSQAGGTSDVGRLRGAYVLRGEERIPVNLKRVQRGRAADLVLEVGDQLYVPESAL